jgi:hypothetical protein
MRGPRPLPPVPESRPKEHMHAGTHVVEAEPGDAGSLPAACVNDAAQDRGGVVQRRLSGAGPWPVRKEVGEKRESFRAPRRSSATPVAWVPAAAPRLWSHRAQDDQCVLTRASRLFVLLVAVVVGSSVRFFRDTTGPGSVSFNEARQHVLGNCLSTPLLDWNGALRAAARMFCNPDR